jgi:hypothetical protein
MKIKNLVGLILFGLGLELVNFSYGMISDRKAQLRILSIFRDLGKAAGL